MLALKALVYVWLQSCLKGSLREGYVSMLRGELASLRPVRCGVRVQS